MFRSVIFQNREIVYQISGEGFPVVLLHGYLMSSWVWNEMMEELSNRYMIIAPDLPGHGRSAAYPPFHTMEFMADAVSAVLYQENISKANIIGHSMGGYVAMAFLENHPGLIKSLCLLNTDPFADLPIKKSERDRVINLIQQGKRNLFIRELLREAIPEGTDVSIDSLRESLFKAGIVQTKDSIISTTQGIKERTDRSLLLQHAEIPVLWLLGEMDTRISATDIKKKADDLDLVCPRLIPCGHMSFLENPSMVLRHIKTILNESAGQ